MEWKFWLTGVISTVLIIFGFVGNACAMYILRKPKMRSAFNQLLIILCIIDSMFLLSNIPTTVMALGLRKYLQCTILDVKPKYFKKQHFLIVIQQLRGQNFSILESTFMWFKMMNCTKKKVIGSLFLTQSRLFSTC